MRWGGLGSRAGQTGTQVLSPEPREVPPWALRSLSPLPGVMSCFKSGGDVFLTVPGAIMLGAARQPSVLSPGQERGTRRSPGVCRPVALASRNWNEHAVSVKYMLDFQAQCQQQQEQKNVKY